MNEALFARAQRASQLAKISTGRNRTSLYAIKHRALQQLLCFAGPEQVELGSDADFYLGLLSVRVIGRSALHTHEGWLPDPARLGLSKEKDAGAAESKEEQRASRCRGRRDRGRLAYR